MATVTIEGRGKYFKVLKPNDSFPRLSIFIAKTEGERSSDFITLDLEPEQFRRLADTIYEAYPVGKPELQAVGQ